LDEDFIYKINMANAKHIKGIEGEKLRFYFKIFFHFFPPPGLTSIEEAFWLISLWLEEKHSHREYPQMSTRVK
jgi:hypothetical protein